MRHFVKFEIKDGKGGKTVRDFLLDFKVSKKTVYLQEQFNLIYVNDERKKLNYQLKKGDILSFKLVNLDKKVVPFDGPVDIIYEDDDIVVVNKPEKLLIHEDGNTINTLTNRINHHFEKQGYNNPVLPAHRLDFETSGLVVFAKHFISLAYLSNEFEQNNIKREYVCLVDHHLKQQEGTIHEKIGKDRHSNKQMVLPSGKEATTFYRVLDLFNDKSKLSVEISSGRTHQIRVHLAYIGHPVIGDTLYGGSSAKRMMLHFKTIKFMHPRTKKQMVVSVDEPF